jgi:hypothetical protein
MNKRFLIIFKILCFLFRASSYIPISRPTDATCDRFLFSIYMCITLHVSSVRDSSSGVPHRTYSLQFLCLCLSAALSCRKNFLINIGKKSHTSGRRGFIVSTHFGLLSRGRFISWRAFFHLVEE